jgi:DMSO/TMAO reductase YedYZ molybdopterin-dependent catalytic subunit
MIFLIVIFSSCQQGIVADMSETEATEYLGVKLTPISQQGNNALQSTKFIDRDTYRLVVDGLVDNPTSLTYAELQSLPQESRLIRLNCVEGWYFDAKWTGPSLVSILEKAKPQSGAHTVIFHTADASGYSSLELDYIRKEQIIIALKLNDVTLPAARGFPFQVVAEGKFGYKWAKWVTRIQLSSDDFLGYWESRGYNNNADINGPAFR